jgi:hypothetical protein
MTESTKKKVMMTVSIEPETRQLISRYARQRAIGQLITRLVKKYDYESRYGPSKLETRLARIEERLLELLEQPNQVMSSAPTTREG